MENKVFYAAVQNGVILDCFDTRDEALERVREEIERDRLSILFKRKLRKLLKRSGNVSLHKYTVLKVTDSEEVRA